MGKEIVYCGGCGKSLREEEFEKGRAHVHENQPYCVTCRPAPAAAAAAALPSLTPRGGTPVARGPAHDRTPLPFPATTRRLQAASGSGSSRAPLLVGAGLAALALVILIILLLSGGSPSEPPPASLPVAEVSQPPRAPVPGPAPVEAPARPDPAAATMARLEGFASGSPDPDAILMECERARADVKGTAYEVKLADIESRAREAKKRRDQERQLSSSLEQARKLLDGGFAAEREAEIRSILEAAIPLAGPRRGEVDGLLGELARKVAAAKTTPAPPPPPPPPAPERPRVVKFVLVNRDITQPIAKYDPLANGVKINLHALPSRNLNIRAVTEPESVGSVVFEFDGKTGVEKGPVFGLAKSLGIPPEQPWTLAPGAHRLTATPHAGPGGTGAAGDPLTITFTVVDDAPPPPPVVPSGAIVFQDGVSPAPSYAGTRDAYMEQHSPEKRRGTKDELSIDGDTPSKSGKDRYGVIKWDLTHLRPGTAIQGASITLFATDSGTDAPYELYELRRPWEERELSWTQAASGKPWQVPGAAGPEDRGSVPLGRFTPTRGGAFSIPLTPAGVAVVQGWINDPARNHGLLMAGPDFTDGIEVSSREALEPANRPALVVVLAPAKAAPLPPPGKLVFSARTSAAWAKFEGGQVVKTGADANALSIPAAGAACFGAFSTPVAASTTLRFEIKPLAEVEYVYALIWSDKAKDNARVYLPRLKKDEWTKIELRAADFRFGGAGDGAPLDGVFNNIKFVFKGPADGKVLLRNLEVRE